MKISIFISMCLFFSFPCLVFAASNFYTDKDVITVKPSSLPVGGSYTEPMTGVTVVRRTDRTDLKPDLPTDSMVVYSRYSPINSNGQYAIVHGTDSTSAWILRLSDNSIVHKLVDSDGSEIGENNEIRWDYTGDNPNRIYFISIYTTDVNGMRFYQMDAIDGNGNPSLIRDFSSDFPNGHHILNDVEGDSSNDSRYWAWQVRGAYDGSNYPLLSIFTYDKQTDSILGILGIGDVTPIQNATSWKTELPRPNMVEISPDGTRVMTNYSRCYPGSPTQDFCGTEFDGAWVWDKNFTNPLKVAVSETHSGWAWDLAGKQMFVSQQNRTDKFQACYTDGTGGLWPLNCIDIFDHRAVNYAGVHFAKMPQSKPGFILASTYVHTRDDLQRSTYYAGGAYVKVGNYQYRAYPGGTTSKFPPIFPVTYGETVVDGTVTWTCRGSMWANNQLLMLELKDLSQNPKVWRVSPSYNDYRGGYRDEGSAAISLDGNSIWWTSNWYDSANGHGEVYSVDLPSDWISKIGSAILPAMDLKIISN